MAKRRINPLSTDVMSVAEAARRTQMSPMTVMAGIRNGTFPGYVVAERRYVIPRLAFDRWLSGEWPPSPVARGEQSA